MKSGTESKLKFKKLQRRLGLKLWECTGLLESIWRCTLQNTPAGDIGRLMNEDIAAAIEWDRPADELIEALVATGWLDRHRAFRLIVHDWSQHCPNHLRGGFERVNRPFADQVKIADDNCDNDNFDNFETGSLAPSLAGSLAGSLATHPGYQLPATSHQSYPNQANSNQTNPSQENVSAEADDSFLNGHKRNSYSPDFLAFWNAYPRFRRTGKGAAYRAWQVALRNGADPGEILQAVAEYAQSPVGSGEFSKMPQTWLTGRCWEDDREAWQGGNAQRASKCPTDEDLANWNPITG